MNTTANQIQENTSKAVVNDVAQNKNTNEPTFQFEDNRWEGSIQQKPQGAGGSDATENTSPFEDNRPEVAIQRKLQDVTNNSAQAQHTSSLQGMMKKSPLAQQTAQLQAMMRAQPTDAVQLKVGFEEELIQEKVNPIQRKENNTGLPDNLKTGVESLSGIDISDVKVHYNSDKPAQLNAHAYAQGTDIHVASGQEKHLPHEAWHVVQQKQGRVQPTKQLKGKVNINDDVGLEREADVMGEKALQAQGIKNESISDSNEQKEGGNLNNKANSQIKNTSSQTQLIQKLLFNTGGKPVQRAINKTSIRDESDHVLGSMDYTFKWEASVPHMNGYIIQFIDRTETIFLGENATIKNYQYWEAWRIVDGAIFSGDLELSAGQHDSWIQRDMPAGSHGEIQMNAQVFYSDIVPTNMAVGNVQYAGGLISSYSDPNVEINSMFSHSHKFEWDRRLTDDNLDNVIIRELRSQIELGFTVEEIQGEEFSWDDFTEDVNLHDGSIDIDEAVVKTRALALILTI